MFQTLRMWITLTLAAGLAAINPAPAEATEIGRAHV